MAKRNKMMGWSYEGMVEIFIYRGNDEFPFLVGGRAWDIHNGGDPRSPEFEGSDGIEIEYVLPNYDWQDDKEGNFYFPLSPKEEENLRLTFAEECEIRSRNLDWFED